MTDLQLVILSEADVRSLLTREDALKAVRAAFAAATAGHARNFPVVREKLTGRVFGIKSAVDEGRKILGFKAGGAFPSNLANGASAHQSSVTLIDFETGQIRAIVSGNCITALRTAAASALSIDLLARPDVRSLGVVGAGAQAEAHIRAALDVRGFEMIRIWSRSKSRAEHLAGSFKDTCECKATDDLRAMIGLSDVVITVTPSTEPLIDNDWVRAGTHLACMGADTAGKQEVNARLLTRARIFTDDVEQSVTIGECQSAVRSGLLARRDIVGTLGDIMSGTHAGRTRPDEITLFDGTGVALQDLFAAQFVLDRARA